MRCVLHDYLVSNRLLWWLTPRQCQESFGLLAVASRNSCMTAGGSVRLKRDAWKEEALDSLPWKDEGGPSSIKHWNRFKGDIGKTSDRQGGAHVGFSEHIYTILNWTTQWFVWCSVSEVGKDTLTVTRLFLLVFMYNIWWSPTSWYHSQLACRHPVAILWSLSVCRCLKHWQLWHHKWRHPWPTFGSWRWTGGDL